MSHHNAATLRILLAVPAVRQADAAALAGDVRATKMACKAWWEAWRQVITHYQHSTLEQSSHA